MKGGRRILSVLADNRFGPIVQAAGARCGSRLQLSSVPSAGDEDDRILIAGWEPGDRCVPVDQGAHLVGFRYAPRETKSNEP